VAIIGAAEDGKGLKKGVRTVPDTLFDSVEFGALAGALLGLTSNPRLLVLLMAMFAGAAAGAVAGKLAGGEVGGPGGQVGGGLVWGNRLGCVAVRRGLQEVLQCDLCIYSS
jgi:hypothetical protein